MTILEVDHIGRITCRECGELVTVLSSQLNSSGHWVGTEYKLTIECPNCLSHLKFAATVKYEGLITTEEMDTMRRFEQQDMGDEYEDYGL